MRGEYLGPAMNSPFEVEAMERDRREDQELRTRLALYFARLPVHGSMAHLIHILGSCGYRPRQIGEYLTIRKVSMLVEQSRPDAVSLDLARQVIDEHRVAGIVVTLDPWL